MALDGFEIIVALEVEEDEPVADVFYRGTQIAAIRAGDVTLYGSSGSIPLAGLIAALVKARSDASPYQ
jgi:hypothetical protein